ncbi:MAG: YhjD/YihY/BrkB family envelope integrity protein, partial [Gemmataceae bacterium]
TLVGPFVVKEMLFAAIYKSLPDVKVTWNVVWLGAFVTAALFSFGNYLIGLYLAYSTTALTFGAAGSLAIVLLWVYYSSQVVLFGAKMTEAYAAYLGQAREPTRQATHI